MPVYLLGEHNRKGRLFELIALKLIKGSKDANKKSFKGYYDIEWNGLKIDVKMRNWVEKKGWAFVTRKPKADYYLLFGVKDSEIKKILFIPLAVFKKHISIYQTKLLHGESKYNRYEVKIKNGYLNEDLLAIVNNTKKLPPKDTKICRQCNIRKPFKEFYLTTFKTPRSICKKCYRIKERSNNKNRREYWKHYYHTVKKFKKRG